MRINIVEKYKNNISRKYTYKNRSDYEKSYSKKEQDMWYFTALMIEKDVNKQEYDSENQDDILWLNKNLKIVLEMDGIEAFSLNEWFEFLSSR